MSAAIRGKPAAYDAEAAALPQGTGRKGPGVPRLRVSQGFAPVLA